MKKKIVLLIVLVLILMIFFLYFFFPGSIFKLTVFLGRASAGLSEKSIQVDDHRIVYLEGGKGPDVLLIHGFGAEKDNWLVFAKYLTKKYHVIIPDVPGFGESSKNQSAKYDIATQVKRLENFTKLLKLGPVHIAGNSMGGCIAGAFAAGKSTRVKSLVLFDSFCVTPPEKSQFQLALDKGENQLLINNTEDFNRVMKLVFYKPFFTPGQFREYFSRKAAENRPFNYKVEEDMRTKPLDLEPMLKNIKIPVLIIWGEDDLVLDKSAVVVLEKGLSKHKTIIFKQCGHVPMIEYPEETAKYYMEFLKDL
jgi:abhydrolase domain-containing protein 6